MVFYMPRKIKRRCCDRVNSCSFRCAHQSFSIWLSKWLVLVRNQVSLEEMLDGVTYYENEVDNAVDG